MRKKNKRAVFTEYDMMDTTGMIDPSKPLSLADLGFALPSEKSTQVVSIRLPTKLMNALKSIGSKKDLPYQSLIKMYLWDRVEKEL